MPDSRRPPGPLTEAVADPMSETATQPTGSLLIIDDEPGIRESLELLLEHEGYSVTTAATGEAGLRALAQKPFDAVLLDLSLPDTTGLEVLRHIRTSDATL